LPQNIFIKNYYSLYESGVANIHNAMYNCLQADIGSLPVLSGIFSNTGRNKFKIYSKVSLRKLLLIYVISI